MRRTKFLAWSLWINGLWAYSFSQDVGNINLDDLEEVKYQQLKNQQKCHIEGLAGNYPLDICFLIRRFSQLSTIPFRNAIMLYGPPGTGKTHIAEKIAAQAGAQLIKKSAASMVTSMQGSGAQAIRDIFTKEVDPQLQNGRIVLFIDEIDAFSRKRNDSSNGDHVGALLELMQKVTEYSNNKRFVIVVATNKKELLDDGMISRCKQIEVPLPDEQKCMAILTHYLNNYPHALKEKIPLLAARAYNVHLSGRDIENWISEAYAKSESIGATKVLFGALLDVLNEIIIQKETEQRKREEEENEIRKEKETRDLQLQALKDEKERRFHERFMSRQVSENGDQDFFDDLGKGVKLAKNAIKIRNMLRHPGQSNDDDDEE